MFSLGDLTFKTENVVHFFENLRGIGYEGRHQIKNDEHRQYVICGIFPHGEINSKDGISIEIEQFKKYLLELDQGKIDSEFYKKFICKGRIAILLNNIGKHGEARLLDPDGIILKDFGITQGGKNVNERHLEYMKHKFVKEFGKHKHYFIVLLSHFIPCTVEEHECSKLIREYVERSHERMIISYDRIWYETDTSKALHLLNHERIHVIKPEERMLFVNKDIARFSLNDKKQLHHIDSCDIMDYITSPYDDFDELVWQRPTFLQARRKDGLPRPGQPLRDSKKKKRGGFGKHSLL